MAPTTHAAKPASDGEIGAPDIHLNLNVRGLLPSATVAINERSDGLRSAGRRIFKMGLGQSPFPVPGLLVRALQENAHQKDYLPVKGLPELRRQIAEHHSKTLGTEYTEEDVMIGPGSKELMFLLQLVYYGDLLVPTPTWVSYVPQARIIGRQVRYLRTRAAQGWRLTPSRLDELCRADPHRPRIVILNYPSNPTGLTYRPRELKELAEVAKRYRIILLSDEIYGKLHHQGEHLSIVPFYPSGTILSGGLSKWCGAGGWRLGFFVFPPALHWLFDAMAVVASETYTSTCAPIQYAAVRAFRNGEEIDRYLFQSRRVLRGLARVQVARLRERGVRVFSPHGGFYLFPDFRSKADRLARRGITSSTALAERLLEETGVAILPGRAFGCSGRELNARSMRSGVTTIRTLV